MILAIDPSGNFDEGKGITGWVLLDTQTNRIAKFGALDASTCLCAEAHWKRHLDLIDGLYAIYGSRLRVVLEDFMLYAHKAESQINSRFETPKLIGLIQYHCWSRNIPIVFQTATSVMRRWKNFMLEKRGYITIKNITKGDKIYEATYIKDYKINEHVVDALRHAVHYYTFHVLKKVSAHDGQEEPSVYPSDGR